MPDNPLNDLVTTEPIGTLLALLTAVLFFGHFIASRAPWQATCVSWLRIGLTSLARATAYLGLVVLSVILLQIEIQTFESEHGSFSREGTATWRAWLAATRDRGLIRQNELLVRFFKTSLQTEQIPASVPEEPALFQEVVVRQEVQQNGITACDGLIEITTAHRGQGSGTDFNIFEAAAELSYIVTNQLDETIEAEFTFPLAGPPVIYRSIQVLVDGRDLTGTYAVSGEGLTWTQPLSPQQSVSIGIRYLADGVEGYLYAVPEARELRDFNLSVLVDDAAYYPMTSPDTISYRYVSQDGWSRNIWTTDRAVMAPTLGLIFIQGRQYAPFDHLQKVLERGPRSVLLLFTLVGLTLLVNSEKVNLSDLLPFSGAALVPFLAIMGCEPLLPAYRIVLPVLVLVSLGLTLLIFRRCSRLARVLILSWTAILLGGYPFSGLLVQSGVINSVDTIVFSTLIIYIFGLTLAVRLAPRSKALH